MSFIPKMPLTNPGIGQVRSDEGEHSEAIFPTSSFVFKNAAQAAARFGQKEPGNIYSRFTNPTVRNFEQRLATLEGGERCIASGMAAIFSTCLGLLKAADHIVASQSIFGSTVTLLNSILSKFDIKTTFVNLSELDSWHFGSTVTLLNSILSKFDIKTTFVNLSDLDSWKSAIQANTKLLFLETPSNPLMELADISAIAEIAHAHDCLLVVDNCFCTPALQTPLSLGADIVLHSATKFLDGQGRCIGGAVIGPENLVGKDIFTILRSGGPTMSPFNAWVRRCRDRS